MQDNSQNNWKTLLENPESFPGETIRDKNEAWEKLYSKLYKKPRRKFMAWYWAAAVLLILTIGSVVFFVNKGEQQDNLVGVPSPVKKRIPVITESALNREQKNSEYILSQPKQKNAAALNRKNVFVKTNQPANKKLITDAIIEQLPQVAITPNMVNDSAIKTLTVAAPAKKKLRVVHLNEIGQSIDEPMVNSKYAEKHGFDLRIINGEIYNPFNSSSSNNGLILTKPRNTSN